MWSDINRVRTLIEEHLARRPGMEPRDVYKLFYQGVRGPEHLITDSKSFIERLRGEWDALESVEDEPLWESIRPDNSLLRLNLRPLKATGGDLDGVAAACLETGRRSWGTQAELRLAWNGFITACREPSWPGLDPEDVEAFTSQLAEKGFPPVHHSERYRNLYQPAYRLIAADVWSSEVKSS